MYKSLNLIKDTSVTDYSTEELKSMGYKLIFECNKKNHDFIRYIEYAEAEGKGVLIVKLDLINRQKKDLVHVWVRDSLSYLNKDQQVQFFKI